MKTTYLRGIIHLYAISVTLVSFLYRQLFLLLAVAFYSLVHLFWLNSYHQEDVLHRSDTHSHGLLCSDFLHLHLYSEDWHAPRCMYSTSVNRRKCLQFVQARTNRSSSRRPFALRFSSFHCVFRLRPASSDVNEGS